MRRLTRWGATIGTLGISVLGLGVMGHNLAAWALPEDAVLEKLNPVPVFTIADEQGAPLVASGENNAKVAGVFISQEAANDFVTQLQTKNPDLANKVKVVPVSLGEVYKLAESNQSQENGLNFAYVPDEEAVNSAKTVLDQNGQTYQGGVPLFVAKGGQDNGYLTIERDSQQVIPFFFEKQQLENMVAKFKEQKPEVADSVNIEVVPLEGVISTLQTSDDEMLNKIVLVPSTESLRFLQQNNAAPESGGQTAPVPAPEAQPAE
ncbi:Tic22 family protein [Myxosarcina sp. GI1(2024)]